MATRFSVTEQFSLPREEVYRALTDLEGAESWMPNLLGIERLDDGELRVGSEWRETRKMFGKEATEHFEVTGLEAPRSIDLRVDGSKGTSRKGEYRFHYELEPGEAGTRVRLEGEIRGLSGVAALLSRLMAGSFRKACAADLTALKEHLEG